MLNKSRLLFLVAGLCFPQYVFAQHDHSNAPAEVGVVAGVAPQPLLAQAIRLQEALVFLGSSLSAEDANRLKALRDKPLTQETTKSIQEILDPYCLARVIINPEARVKVTKGAAKP